MKPQALAAALVTAAAFSCMAAEAPVKARMCVPCHGPMGLSVQPDAPNLAGQPRGYLMAQLAAYRSGKRVNEQMNVMAKGLTDAEIAEIAEWFSSFVVEAKAPR